MGFFSKLFNGAGRRVEDTIMYLVDVETRKVKHFLSHKEKYKNYNEYCQSRTSIVNKSSAETAVIEDWIIFETVLRVFRKISKTELVEYRDFNYENEIVGTRIYNEEVGHIIIESFLDQNKKRLIEVHWQDEYTIS
jgi:hypothetical protein